MAHHFDVSLADGVHDSMRKVIICGAGAVGSTYVERLSRLDPDAVSIVAGGERGARLSREGVLVNGRAHRVRCLMPGASASPADLLVIGVKHHHLAKAIDDVRGFVGKDTLIVSLLNGISSEGILARAFGSENLLHAYVVATDAVREQGHTRYTNIGRLVFGKAEASTTHPQVMALRALLERAQIPHEVPEDIQRSQWWKFMLNVGVNQVSAVLRAPYAAFAIPEVNELTRRAALEAVAVAAKEGVRLTAGDVDAIFPILATLAPDGKSSMLQDVEAGRKTEVEIFAGAVIDLGLKHGVATPVNEMLGIMIAGLEKLTQTPGTSRAGEARTMPPTSERE